LLELSFGRPLIRFAGSSSKVVDVVHHIQMVLCELPSFFNLPTIFFVSSFSGFSYYRVESVES